MASQALKGRIQRASFLKKLCRPEDLLHHFPNGASIGWSGFTGVGYPKYVINRESRPVLCVYAAEKGIIVKLT